MMSCTCIAQLMCSRIDRLVVCSLCNCTSMQVVLVGILQLGKINPMECTPYFTSKTAQYGFCQGSIFILVLKPPSPPRKYILTPHARFFFSLVHTHLASRCVFTFRFFLYSTYLFSFRFSLTTPPPSHFTFYNLQQQWSSVQFTYIKTYTLGIYLAISVGSKKACTFFSLCCTYIHSTVPVPCSNKVDEISGPSCGALRVANFSYLRGIAAPHFSTLTQR